MYWLVLAIGVIAPIVCLFYVFKSTKIDYFDRSCKDSVLNASMLGAFMAPISIFLGISLCKENVYIIDACSGTFLVGWILPTCALIFILGKVMLPRINIREYSKRPYNILGDRVFRGKLMRRLGLSISLMPVIFFLFYDSGNLTISLSGEDAYNVYVEIACLAIIFAGGMFMLCIPNFFSKLWEKDKDAVFEKISIQEINSNKAPIVLLRSFEIMTKSNLASTGYDENLFSPFVRSGYPVIALADPDIAKYGGSIKFEAKDDSWQKAIELILARTSAVIMLEGKTDGLQWEISKVKKYVAPERFFVITLPEKMRMDCWYPKEGALFVHNRKNKALKAFDFIWKSFSGKLMAEGIYSSQENPGNGAILSFGKDWNVSKKTYYRDGDELFSSIISIIGESLPDYDYQELYNQISCFEVQKNMPEAYINKFQKYSKVIRLCLWFFIPLSLILMCIMAQC